MLHDRESNGASRKIILPFCLQWNCHYYSV